MPTYQFRCPDGSIIERVFKMSDVPQTIPSPDGSGDAVRMISGGADLIFKGSGFYITDYGKDGKKDQREAASKSEAKNESKTDSKSDSSVASAKEGSAPAASSAPAPKPTPPSGQSE
jgi:predicted nucleic acid-binding Zn ribbon protein